MVSGISVASILLLGAWFVFIRSIAGTFQVAHGSDALAMINILFPVFWLFLLGYLFLSFLTIYSRSENKYLHSLQLCGLALLLFLTPFLLSGFSWSPDSLFHGGVASYIPEIFSGEKIPLSNYAASYPASFIHTFLVEEITGLTIFQYTLLVYPPIAIVTFTLLAYCFISQVVDASKAFISLLVALPALHFIELHVSPFSIGTLLILTALMTLTSKSGKVRLLFFFSILALILTHPVSPLSLGIFLGSALLIQVVQRFYSHHRWHNAKNVVSNISWELMFFLVICWLIWTLNWATTQYPSINSALSRIFTLQFLRDLQLISEFTGKGGFIYGGVQLLNLLIYGIFGILDLIVFLFSLLKFRSNTEDPHLILSLFFSSSGLVFAVYGFSLYLGTGEHVLLGRGLLFFIFSSSITLTLQLFQQNQKRLKPLKQLALFTLLTFLFITFPVNSYSKEAYNTHTPTSEAGLHFIATTLDLSTHSISMAASRQLASYVDLTQGLLLAPYPPPLPQTTPDYIALRINSYFLISMRYDLNFHNNTFTQLRENLEVNSMYNKIYTNSLFDLYAPVLDE